jgi:type VI secretion system protein ImpA
MQARQGAAINKLSKYLTPMIEVEKLIRPVSSEHPAGESLRYSTVYDSIKAARHEDDPNLPRGIWQTKLKKADWLEVKSLCLEALESRSKDLQIGAWLLEACIHIDGFAGVSDGLSVLTALCENFWDTLYPPIDPDDPDYRYGPITWINEKLTLKLKLIPITNPKGGDEPPFGWADSEAALHQTRVSTKEKSGGKKPAAEQLRPLQARFTASSELTPNEFYVDLKRQVANALAESDRFEQVLARFDERQRGALHQMKDLMRSIYYFVSQVLTERKADVSFEPGIENEVEPPILEEEETDMVKEQREYPFSGPIRSRAQAYQMLSEAADYLMKTEPHSPTPYLVRRAVAWGGLSLGELLHQILRNPGELGEMYRLLGLDEMPQKGKKGE